MRSPSSHRPRTISWRIWLAAISAKLVFTACLSIMWLKIWIGAKIGKLIKSSDDLVFLTEFCGPGQPGLVHVRQNGSRQNDTGKMVVVFQIGRASCRERVCRYV